MKLPKIKFSLESSEIWIKILGHCILGKRFSNPYREDKNPSAVLFQSQSGDVLLHDFKDGTFNWRSYLKYYLNYDKEQIANFLKNNNLLIISKNFKEIEAKPRKKITYLLKEWCNIDTEYWKQFNITKEICEFFKVYPVKYTWINDIICHTYIDTSPVYVYILGNEFKIYAPFHYVKWLSNIYKESYQGYDQLPWLDDLLIITKSMKDVMSLYSLGYNAIAPHSEGQKIPNDIIIGLQHRFTKIVVLYDNDDAGIKASNKLNREYKLKQIYMINAKDVSDNIKKCGVNETKKYLKDVL